MPPKGKRSAPQTQSGDSTAIIKLGSELLLEELDCVLKPFLAPSSPAAEKALFAGCRELLERRLQRALKHLCSKLPKLSSEDIERRLRGCSNIILTHHIDSDVFRQEQCPGYEEGLPKDLENALEIESHEPARGCRGCGKMAVLFFLINAGAHPLRPKSEEDNAFVESLFSPEAVRFETGSRHSYWSGSHSRKGCATYAGSTMIDTDHMYTMTSHALCDKCGERGRVGYFSSQTRSSDEGETKFYKCFVCLRMWPKND